MTKPQETITGRTDALRSLDVAVDVIVGFALLSELVVVIANVFGRMFFEAPLLWADEV